MRWGAFTVAFGVVTVRRTHRWQGTPPAVDQKEGTYQRQTCCPRSINEESSLRHEVDVKLAHDAGLC